MTPRNPHRLTLFYPHHVYDPISHECSRDGDEKARKPKTKRVLSLFIYPKEPARLPRITRSIARATRAGWLMPQTLARLDRAPCFAQHMLSVEAGASFREYEEAVGVPLRNSLHDLAPKLFPLSPGARFRCLARC